MNESNTAKRGRPAKPIPEPTMIMKAVIQFLQIFMTETMAKRIVVVVLISVGISNARITKLSGMGDRSIWKLKKAIYDGETDGLFSAGKRSGRPGNAKGFEGEIIEEIDLNYLTKKVTTVANDKYITATEVCEILRKVATEYAGNAIHIVLDNARYQNAGLQLTLLKNWA